MSDPHEIADAVTERLQTALPDWQIHAWLPSENPPHLTVYDPDGNIVHEMDPPVIVWEPVEPVPTMTVTLSDDVEGGWTELTP